MYDFGLKLTLNYLSLIDNNKKDGDGQCFKRREERKKERKKKQWSLTIFMLLHRIWVFKCFI